MKRILLLMSVVLIGMFPSRAEESKNISNSGVIELGIRQQTGAPTILRTPLHVNIDAYYDADRSSICVNYDGEAEGEVFLYLNGNMIGYSSEINTSLSTSGECGLYAIEIVTDSWIAYGELSLP